jgi:gliding motility-associated-like protein
VVDYTFYDYGTYYMRYTVANDDGTCPFYSDVFTIVVNESDLQCPNFFSPGSTEGVNDIWKVSYKSLVEFHCWIYNRWGNLVYEFTDPGDGWDGTYRGKPVGTGVYYYVIKATGSDGVKYSPRGAISILNYTGHGDGTNTNVDPGN